MNIPWLNIENPSVLVGISITIIILFGTGFLKKAGEVFYSWIHDTVKPKKNKQSILKETNTDLVKSDLFLSSTATLELNENNKEIKKVKSKTSPIKVNDISEAYQAAPPLQREQLLKNYIGLKIEWETTYISGSLKEGIVNVTLRSKDCNYGIGWISCEVPLEENRELSILHADAEIKIIGEIEEVRRSGITIKNATLLIN